MTCEIYDFCSANIILNRRQRLVSGPSSRQIDQANMAEGVLDKLIEAVKSLKDNSSATSEASQNPPSTEAAINRLFPSIGTFRSTAPGRLNPNSNYVPTRRKRNANPASTSSATKKKAPAGNSKPVLKDIILLPSPRIESVSRGRFR